MPTVQLWCQKICLLEYFICLHGSEMLHCMHVYIIAVDSCYRIVIWLCCCERPSDDILFFMSVKENTVPVNIRQHGNVVTNSFFLFAGLNERWFSVCFLAQFWLWWKKSQWTEHHNVDLLNKIFHRLILCFLHEKNIPVSLAGGNSDRSSRYWENTSS